MSKIEIKYSHPSIERWVPETSYGDWFLSTDVWKKYVLDEAFDILKKLTEGRVPKDPVILDAGCGQGQTLPIIDEVFKPKKLVGLDIDQNLLQSASGAAEDCVSDVELIHASAEKTGFADNSFDIISCHQLIHHVSFQDELLQEFYRLLKPGGLLLVSESCKPFLDVYWVRWFFRHPDMVQKTAKGYIDLVRKNGYLFEEKDICETVPWWALRDLGVLRKLGLQFWKSKTAEIAIIAQKPYG